MIILMSNPLQITVFFITIVISIATFLLGRSIIVRCVDRKKMKIDWKKASYLFWGTGVWLFGLTTLFEAMFSIGIYSTFLADLYLFLIVVLVELLSVGSILLIKSEKIKKGYYAFLVIITLATLAAILTETQGNLIVDYVVAGTITAGVILTSSIATFASSIVLVGVAIKSYLARHDIRMLSIIAGVVIVAIAGTLYIAAYPWLLYVAEFVGMVLLWIGFR